MKVVVYKCTACGKLDINSSNVRKHVALVCDGASIKKLRGTVVLEEEEEEEEEEECVHHTPGPRPIDPKIILRGRIQAFGDDGDDERIDVLFANGKVDEMLGLDVVDIPRFLFVHAWSSLAPHRLQSLCVIRKTLYAVTSLDEEHGEVSVVARGPITKSTVRHLALYLLDFVFSIVKHSIPVRRGDDDDTGKALYSKLCDTTHGQTVRDALRGHSGDLRDDVDAMLDNLRCALDTHVVRGYFS